MCLHSGINYKEETSSPTQNSLYLLYRFERGHADAIYYTTIQLFPGQLYVFFVARVQICCGDDQIQQVFLRARSSSLGDPSQLCCCLLGYKWFDNAGVHNFTDFYPTSLRYSRILLNQKTNNGVGAIIPNQTGVCLYQNERI
ncbi:Hypothetical_protein [Hexamita inflata]|uniref:Hypothetical_protein n=1 Tax=Hexamita inflata TaxID=28002 RepID=A0AA86QI56_9EUKA|nr:Hypothetical protein HINF_LOCUS41334 [Hexamita inflata]